MKKNTTYNQPHKAPKPEEIVINVEYSFTINPETQPTKHNTETFIQEGHKHLKHYLTRCKYSKYTLYTELSSTGRLHYHGYVTINNISGFYIHDIHLLKYLGSFEIDTISQMDTWENYIKKQQGIFEAKPLNIAPICYHFGTLAEQVLTVK